MLLRDIIDLETTYARLNEDSPDSKNLSNNTLLNKNEILQSNKININNILDKPGSNENLKPKNEIFADNDNEDDNDENDDEDDENDTNLSLIPWH